MNVKMTRLSAALLAAALATGVNAQSGKDNLNTMKQMKVATTDLNIPVVPQTGRNADASKAALSRVIFTFISCY